MALLFARDNEIGEDRDHRAVHRHGDRHLIQRNAVEEDFHILNRIDGHTGLADIALDPRMVTVIAPVRCQIEGHRNTLLPGGQRAAVKGVGFLSRRKTCILPDRPRTARVHRRLHAARKRSFAGNAAEMLQPVHVVGGIERLYVDPLQRLPRQIIKAASAQFARGQFLPACLGVLLVGCHMLVLLP